MRNTMKKWIALLLALCLLTGGLAALADGEAPVEATEVEETSASVEPSEPKAEAKTSAAESGEPKPEAKPNAETSGSGESAEEPYKVDAGAVKGETGKGINISQYMPDNGTVSTDDVVKTPVPQPSPAAVVVSAKSVEEEGNSGGTYNLIPYGIYISTYNTNLDSVEVDVEGDVSIKSEQKAARGVMVTSSDKKDTFKIDVGGSVTAETKAEEYARGLDVEGSGASYQVDVKGDVTASSQGNSAAGIYITGSGSKTVQVGGDVTATAKGDKKEGYGLDVSGMLSSGNEATVLIDGTLSGNGAAVYVGSGNADELDLYVWKAEGGSDGETIVQTSGNDQKVASAVEKAIWYIVKVASGWEDKLSVSATATREVYDKAYTVAHEDDAVTLKFDIEAGKELDSIQYNDKVNADYTKNDDGSYTVKMLRGGAMLLAFTLKDIVEQEPELPVVTVEDPKPEETKPEETKPEETKPEETKPEEPKPEETKPEETKPEETKPEETPAEETTPEETEPEATPAEKPAVDADEAEKKESHSAPKPVFVYVAIPEAHGLSGAGRPAAADAIAALGDGLSGEGATVDLVDKDKLMNEDEIVRLDAMPVAERMRVALALMGIEEAAGALSEAGQALVDDVNARVAGLTDAERQARQAIIDAAFQPRLIIVDGAERVSVGLELKVVSGGKTTRERYTFFNDGGAWKLYQIERGVYRQQ